jgi:hypothetical protein
MILEVVQKEQNKRLVTKQTKEGQFQRWKSIREFQSSGSGTTTTTTTTTTPVNHIINYELPPTTIEKIANVVTGSQAENKIR